MTVKDKTKGMLYDATNSWNGYSYQGRLGLFVCLSKISQLLTSGTEAELAEIKLYQLEYEWLEDFSLVRGEEYISLHQIKHYNESRFSRYIDAFKTIFERKIGKLSEQDLSHYLKTVIEKSASDRGDGKLTLDGAVKDVMDSLISSRIIDDEHCLVGLSNDYSGNYKEEVSLYLKDVSFIISVFSNCPIYLHTSLKIANMDFKSIFDYADFKCIKNKVNNKNEPVLKNNGVFYDVEGGNGSDMKLTLSDDELNKEINIKLKSVLDVICPIKKDRRDEIYLCSLKSLIDFNIQKRHHDLSIKNINRYLLQTKTRLSFSSIIEILSKALVEESQEYWESLCRESLFSAYNSLNKDYQDLLSDDELSVKEKTVYSQQKEALQHYFAIINSDFIVPGNTVDFLERLRFDIDVGNDERKSVYYHDISQPEYLQENFFSFLVNLTIKGKDSILFNKDMDIYHASAVKFSEKFAHKRKAKIDILRACINDRKGMITQGVSHVILDCPEADGQTANLKSITVVDNVLGSEYECELKNNITTGKVITLIHSDTARDNLNGQNN